MSSVRQSSNRLRDVSARTKHKGFILQYVWFKTIYCWYLIELREFIPNPDSKPSPSEKTFNRHKANRVLTMELKRKDSKNITKTTRSE